VGRLYQRLSQSRFADAATYTADRRYESNCCDFSCAICVLHYPVQDPWWLPHALINSRSRAVLHNLRLFHVEILL
jgi:hypothetical protein